MIRFALALCAGIGISTLAMAEKPEPAPKDKDEPKGEVLKTVISATASFDADKKKLSIEAVGQVPTGGWKGAKLTPVKAKEAPKDGIYEFELTAVRPDGIVTQALSKVKASYTWENPPADLKGIKINGAGDGAKSVKIEK